MSDPFPADSLVGTGSAAAPGAGAVVADVTVPVGVYRVLVKIELTGTAEVALRNLRLRQNGVAVAAVEDLPTLSGTPIELTIPELTATGTGVIDVIAIAAATAGSIYNVQITADRIR